MAIARHRELHGPSITVTVAAGCAFAAVLCGCGSSSSSNTGTVPPTKSAESYFAAAVSGAYPGSSTSDSEYLSTYTVDDSKKTFAQSIYTFGSGDQKGPQLDYSGTSVALDRGLSEFEISYSNSLYGASVNSGAGISYDPPLGGNWFFELPNQAGGLANFKGMPFVPMVAAQDCPGTKAQNFEFVSIPTYIGPDLAGPTGGIHNWNPDEDTAYGLVQVSGSGTTVLFANIRQYTVSGSKVTSYPHIAGNPAAVTSATGACSPTFYGNTIGVPAQADITNPGVGETIASPAVVGIGPSGLLLENNGQTSNLVSNAGFSGFEPFLGSGTGAIGVQQPSSAIDVGAVTGAQYVGVIYGGGTTKGDWTSVVVSFGFPSTPAGCPSGNFVTPLLGGDYPGNDPTQSATGNPAGFGNCNVVIDLGNQDPSNNGLFPTATVYLANGFAGKQRGTKDTFPATAIAGQLNGKYVIFVIGVDASGDSKQAWGIYLFQSS